MLVMGKALGSRRKLFDAFSVPLPPGATDGGGDGGEGGEGMNLRKLIELFVRAEVAAYEARREQSAFVRALSDRQIAAGVEAGKVDSGGRELLAGKADAESAVHAAWEAFEDGLYLVVIDGEEQRELDRRVSVTDDSQVTFVRLVFLAGG